MTLRPTTWCFECEEMRQIAGWDQESKTLVGYTVVRHARASLVGCWHKKIVVRPVHDNVKGA